MYVEPPSATVYVNSPCVGATSVVVDAEEAFVELLEALVSDALELDSESPVTGMVDVACELLSDLCEKRNEHTMMTITRMTAAAMMKGSFE